MLVLGISAIIALAMFISTLITDPVYKEYIQYVLSGLVMLTMAIVPFFIESHTKKYLETKGANLAQKEDLEDLTLIVSQVKKQFESDNAILKAKLDVVSGTALNLKDEERKAIIALNESYFKWISMIRGNLIASSISDIENHENGIKEAFNEMVYKESAFILFIGNNDMLTDYTSLKIKSTDGYVTQRSEIVENIKSGLFSIENTSNRGDIDEFRNEILQQIKNFGTVLEQQQDIMRMELQFQLKCRTFLYC